MKKISIAVIMMTAGCASGGAYEMSEKTAESLAKFERTGEFQNCLNVSQIDGITPLDERHFLVRYGVSKYYLNELPRSCFGAGRAGNRLQYTVYGGQICRNEIVHVVDNTTGMAGGACGLSSFERLEKIPQAQSTD